MGPSGPSRERLRRSGSERRAPLERGGGGGKVIEDRRFGIYDSRRYRMEGEPAPPDPSDDEDAAGRSTSVRGRGAADAGKKKATNAEKEKEKAARNKSGGRQG